MREFTEPHLVQYLSWLRVAPVVAFFGLIFGEVAQGASGKMRVHDHRLQGDDEAVPAENRDKPGHAGSGHPGEQSVFIAYVDAKRADVIGALLYAFANNDIGGFDPGDAIMPLPVYFLGLMIPGGGLPAADMRPPLPAADYRNDFGTKAPDPL